MIEWIVFVLSMLASINGLLPARTPKPTYAPPPAATAPAEPVTVATEEIQEP